MVVAQGLCWVLVVSIGGMCRALSLKEHQTQEHARTGSASLLTNPYNKVSCFLSRVHSFSRSYFFCSAVFQLRDNGFSKVSRRKCKVLCPTFPFCCLVHIACSLHYPENPLPGSLPQGYDLKVVPCTTTIQSVI